MVPKGADAVNRREVISILTDEKPKRNAIFPRSESQIFVRRHPTMKI
jgi:hypothetical protein